MIKGKTKKYLFYLGGQIGLMLQLRFFFQWILDFCTRDINGVIIFSGFFVGVLLLAFRIFDCITDPLAGSLSDYLYFKGKSRSYLMKIFAPLISLGLIVSFLPQINNSIYINWLLLVSGFFLFFLGYTLYCIPLWSMIDSISENEKEKEKISFSLGLGIFIATAIGFVLTPFLINSMGYFYSSVTVGVGTLPLLYLPTFINEEKQINKGNYNNRLNIKDEFKKLLIPFSNKNFINSVTLLSIVQFSFTCLTSIAPVFVEVVLHKDRSFIAFIMGPIILLAILTFAFLSKITSKYELNIILFRVVIFQGLLFCLIYPVLFSSTSNLNVQILFALFGIPIAIVLGIEALIITNIAKPTGLIGIHFGAFNFVVKGLNGVALLITGIIIEQSRITQFINLIPLFFLTLGFTMIVLSFLLRKNVL